MIARDSRLEDAADAAKDREQEIGNLMAIEDRQNPGNNHYAHANRIEELHRWQSLGGSEAPIGFEPMHKGFADLSKGSAKPASGLQQPLNSCTY
jgi:hypothetical protein